MADAPDDDDDDDDAHDGGAGAHDDTVGAQAVTAEGIATVGVGVVVVGAAVQAAARWFPETTSAIGQWVADAAAPYVLPAIVQATQDAEDAAAARATAVGASRETSRVIGRGVRRVIEHATGCKEEVGEVVRKRRRDDADERDPSRPRLVDRA
jgi:hypothetical protein